MATPVLKGGAALLVRPDGEDDQILAVDLTVRPQGPFREVVLPLGIAPAQAGEVKWLATPDHALFTRLESLFHPLVEDPRDGAVVAPDAAAPRLPTKATVEGGVAVGREGLVQVGMTGHTGEVSPDAVCVWARITPPPAPLLVRWLGLNWGWPKAALAVRMPRPSPRMVTLPTRGLANWPEGFHPAPALYVQAPRRPGPVWVDPQQAPGHPFDWRLEERPGSKPAPLVADWPLYRAFTTDRAAAEDVVLELLDRGDRPTPSEAGSG